MRTLTKLLFVLSLGLLLSGCATLRSSPTPTEMEKIGTDGETASLWSIQMTVQEAMIRFLKEAAQSQSGLELDKAAIKYAEELSVISPNPKAKQLLFDLCHEVFLEHSSIAAKLDPSSEAYQVELEGYSDVVARYIFHQQWKK